MCAQCLILCLGGKINKFCMLQTTHNNFFFASNSLHYLLRFLCDQNLCMCIYEFERGNFTGKVNKKVQLHNCESLVVNRE